MGLFPDVVTLYNSLGEVDRRVSYKRTVLEGVRIEQVVGKMKRTDPSLFIPKPEGFVEPIAFEGEGWTLQEGDLVVAGISSIEIPDDTVADLEAAHHVYRVVGHSMLKLGRRLSLDVGLA